jgi:Spy/CpxP family protein refolding chaperone
MRISAATIALILVATFAWAQPSGPALTGLKTYLSLTDGQVQSLQTIQKGLRSSTATLRQQVAAKQTELNTNLQSGSASAATVGQLQLDILALRKQIGDAEAATRPQMLAVLTPNQQALLQKLVEAQKLQAAVREAEMLGLVSPAGGRGPGMGMGRGMGMGMGRGMGMGPGPGGRGGAGMMGPRRGGPGAPPPPPAQ